MNKELEKILEKSREIIHLRNILAVLSWDRQTHMPDAASDERAGQESFLSGMIHEKETSEEMGNLIFNLDYATREFSDDSFEKRLASYMKREFDKKSRVPVCNITKYAETVSLAQSAWESARLNNDFEVFAPHLEKIIEDKLDYASFFKPYDSVYDPLLDDFEPGLKSKTVDLIFEDLKKELSDFLFEIDKKPTPNDDFLYSDYDCEKQWNFALKVMKNIGFDFKRGNIDKSTHPFTEKMGVNDVRSTGRVFQNNLSSALFSSIHECGHALYEMGISAHLAGTFLHNGSSLSIHESQSRYWENIIARSESFWKYYFPELKKLYPEQLKKINIKEFYRAVNIVKPSAIRVESDEISYNLHIILRYELEKKLLSSELKVSDLPEAWNQKMKDCLGITVKSYDEGVLQDIHWSAGLFGYFPTYSIGNIISAQFHEKIKSDISGFDKLLENGDFTVLLSWLQEHVHRHGAKYSSEELVKNVTGSNISSKPYISYLKNKYSKIYKL